MKLVITSLGLDPIGIAVNSTPTTGAARHCNDSVRRNKRQSVPFLQLARNLTRRLIPTSTRGQILSVMDGRTLHRGRSTILSASTAVNKRKPLSSFLERGDRSVAVRADKSRQSGLFFSASRGCGCLVAFALGLSRDLFAEFIFGSRLVQLGPVRGHRAAFPEPAGSNLASG